MVMFEDYHIPACPPYTCVTHYNSNQGHLLTQRVLSRFTSASHRTRGTVHSWTRSVSVNEEGKRTQVAQHTAFFQVRQAPDKAMLWLLGSGRKR